MRIYLQLLTIILTYCLNAQNIIVNPAGVPESSMSAELLTSDVLISGEGCSTSISNFELKDNPQAQYPSTNKSWGYFQKGTSNFPFESGIILTSGRATDARGPNGPRTDYGGNGWLGVPMLNVISGNPTRNATVFEFDFIPYVSEISFRYIFASKEYSDDFGEGFECSGYNDVFAFVISGPGIVNDPGITGKNIALLPNGDPVTIDNVNGVAGCGDDTYFVHINNNAPPIKYNGMTTPLTASSTVIPGQTYHIRLMVADAVDTQYDSAVFLEAGSFNLGSTLTDENGVELGDEQVVCGMEEYTLNLVVNNPLASIKWYLNNVEIPGETSPSLTVTESGIYTVGVSLVADCEERSSVEILFRTFPVAADYQDAIKCTTGLSEIFDLREYEDFISTPDMVYSYYNTFNGANTADLSDLINNFTNFPVIGIVEVFVRVQNGDGCHVVAKLTLEASQIPTTQPQTYAVCDDNGDGISEFNLDLYNSQIITSDLTNLNIEYYTDPSFENIITNSDSYPNISNPQIVYAKAFYQNANDLCFETVELTLIVNEFPEITDWTMPAICNNLDDDSEFIDLTVNEIVVTQGIIVDLRYFPSLNDLNAETNEILTPENYEYTGDVNTIFVKVTNSAETCTDYATIELSFSDGPLVQSSVLESCSIDGSYDYFLPDANPDIIDGQNPDDFTITYHTLEQQAVDGTNSLGDNYTNITSNDKLYVRIIDNATGCFNVTELDLITTLLIHQPSGEILQSCDDPFELNDGLSEFNLTEMNDAINNLFGGINYTVKYYISLEKAQENEDEITNNTAFPNESNFQKIYARAFDGDNACIGTTEFLLETLTVPEFDLVPSLSFCINDEKTYEFLENYESYTWYNANGDIISNEKSVEFPDGGIYILEITESGFECPAARQLEVIIQPSPVILDVNVSDHLVTVNATGNGPLMYSFDNGFTWVPNNSININNYGVYNMLVRSNDGCISEGKIFGVLGIPNIITPNGDGYNDYFTIKGMNAYPEAQIKIFDKYSRLYVDQKVGENFKWDGKTFGSDLPTGDYWYILTVEPGRQLSGHFTLKNK